MTGVLFAFCKWQQFTVQEMYIKRFHLNNPRIVVQIDRNENTTAEDVYRWTQYFPKGLT